MRPRSESPDAALERLRTAIDAYDSMLVAFSGGTDSALVLRVAHERLGDRCVALTTVSPSTPAHDRRASAELAGALGIRHLRVETNELDVPEYAANPVNRCFFCKTNLFDICERERARLGLAVVADGANVDDLGDHRPGLEAAARHGVRHPLVDAGLGKADVRAVSRALELPTWDRPSSPCLSSRVPYGTPITRPMLARIDEAEQYLRGLGLRELRVRAHDTLARIEVTAADLPRLVDPAVRGEIARTLHGLGFVHVALDLDGFRSGSLNEGVVGEQTRDARKSGSR
jgi:uncharacterized protein